MTGPPELPPAGVPPVEAIAFFRSKGFQIGFAWEDVFRAEHVRWFTVAKAMSRDLLEDIRAAVDSAIADGTTLADFKRTLRPVLEARGWWGRKRMIDPLTGENKVVQLGSPRRLKTIFDTNMRTAYQAGKWERIQRTARAFPYLEYTSVMDGRERPEHRAWDGVILPVDDPWWETHYPPCDWNCRCSVVQRSARMLERASKSVTKAPPRFPDEPWTNRRTGETGMIERGLGKGWDYNVGAEYLRGLSPPPLPGGFAGPPADETVDAALRPSPREARLIDRFLDAFGAPEKQPGTLRETIWTDRAGWPLAISRGWFISPGRSGRPELRVPPAPVLERIIGTLTSPAVISWAWVRGADGRALLMRRYLRIESGAAMQVDIGAAGWRWRIVPAAEVAAGFNPHQPRHGKGGPAGGRFKTTHAGPLRASLSGDRTPVRKAWIGLVSDSTRRLVRKAGVEVEGARVSLDHSYAIKILNKHGKGFERMPRQVPVSVNDLFKAAALLNRSIDITPDPRGRTGRDGQRRFEARTRTARMTYHMVFQVSQRSLTLVTMYKVLN